MIKINRKYRKHRDEYNFSKLKKNTDKNNRKIFVNKIYKYSVLFITYED